MTYKTKGVNKMSKVLIKEEHGSAYTINDKNEFIGYPLNEDGTIDKECEFFIDYSFLDEKEVKELEKIRNELVK